MTATALITGVAGQDGLYLARHLHHLGYSVIGTYIEDTPRLDVYAPFVAGHSISVTDRRGMAEVIQQYRPQEIYNFASRSSVARSWQDPLGVVEVNAVAAANLFGIVASMKGYSPRICHVGSAEMYGPAMQRPQNEAGSFHPTNPYAFSKVLAHESALAYRRKYDLFICNAILFNHESPLRPSDFVSRTITGAAAAIALGRAHEVVLGNLTVRRDWGWAPDFVRGMHLMATSQEPDDYVLATGQVHTVEQFAHMALAAAGVDATVRSDPARIRAVDIPVMWGDPAKANDLLGWHPTKELPEIVGDMVRADIDRLRTGVDEMEQYA